MKFQDIKAQVVQDNPGITLIYRNYKHADGRLVFGVDYLGLPKQQRGTGLARRAFEQLIEYAQQYDFWIATTPTALFGSDTHRLSTALDGYGFTVNPSARDDTDDYSMIREPQYQHVLTEDADETLDPAG